MLRAEQKLAEGNRMQYDILTGHTTVVNQSGYWLCNVSFDIFCKYLPIMVLVGQDSRNLYYRIPA
jgi:hypothetical protein